MSVVDYLVSRGLAVRNKRLFPKCVACGLSYPVFPFLVKCPVCHGSLRYKSRKHKKFLSGEKNIKQRWLARKGKNVKQSISLNQKI